MDNSKVLATWWLGTCYYKEQLDAILDSTDVHRYAWILHDKDIDRKTNEPKKPHFHFLVQFLRNQRGSWFKRFWSDDMGRIFPEPVKAPQGAFDYLIHDTPKARKDGKYLYDAAERVSTLENLELDETEDSKKLTASRLRELVLVDGKSPSAIMLEHELSITQIALLDRLYAESMSKSLQNTLRTDIQATYIFGRPRTGKTSHVFQLHQPGEFYRVTNYRHPFDNYAYQKILVLDEYDSQLDIEYINNILDIYPCELACRFYNKWAAWNRVYVISNISLMDQYPDQVSSKRKAFQSRFHEVIDFDSKPGATLTQQQLTPLTDQEQEELGF